MVGVVKTTTNSGGRGNSTNNFFQNSRSCLSTIHHERFLFVLCTKYARIRVESRACVCVHTHVCARKLLIPKEIEFWTAFGGVLTCRHRAGVFVLYAPSGAIVLLVRSTLRVLTDTMMAQPDDSNAGLRTTFSQTNESPLIEENEVVKSPVVAALREYFAIRNQRLDNVALSLNPQADFSTGIEEVVKDIL